MRIYKYKSRNRLSWLYGAILSKNVTDLTDRNPESETLIQSEAFTMLGLFFGFKIQNSMDTANLQSLLMVRSARHLKATK